MKRLVLVCLFVTIFSLAGLAQKGTAEPDYYPMGYAGETWTGKVTSVDEDKREFTLTYKKKDKEVTFTIILPAGYTVKMKDGTDYQVKMSDLMGFMIKAYYMTKTSKDEHGNKVETHNAFKIKFLTDK